MIRELLSLGYKVEPPNSKPVVTVCVAYFRTCEGGRRSLFVVCTNAISDRTHLAHRQFVGGGGESR
jgi:hypothetical protein